VLLTFGDEYPSGLSEKFGQTVKDAADTLNVPNPASTVRPPLAELLVGHAAGLEEQFSLFVTVWKDRLGLEGMTITVFNNQPLFPKPSHRVGMAATPDQF
jgi:hypothetical protein